MAMASDNEAGAELLVRARGLGKSYRIYRSARHRLAEWLTLGRAVLHRDFWALRGVDLEVRRGDRLGVLGMNGAGKSTLLELIAGLLQPDEGDVTTTGNVAALLELGAGFHPDFTGRENVLLAGQLRGLSRALMRDRMADIVEFAEIGDFVDQPVRTYSSGMLVRLAFSVATMVVPDVLIVDEVMAVGDVFFQHKCMRRIRELTSVGTALVFVSHSTDQVRSICDRGLVLDAGRPVFVGSSERAADLYLKHIRERETAAALAGAAGAAAPAEPARPAAPTGFPPAHAFEYGAAEPVRIVNVEVLDDAGRPRDSFRINEEVQLRITARVTGHVEQMGASFLVRDRAGVDLVGTTSHHYGYTLDRPEPGGTVTFTFGFRNVLRPGHYSISAAVNRLERPGDPRSGLTLHQFDNVAGYKSAGLTDMDVYHRVYVPVAVQVQSVAAQAPA